MNALDNPYLVTPLAVLLIVQMLKYLIPAIQGKYDVKNLVRLDGVPSLATALAVSMIPVSLTVSGSQSPGVGITVVVALVVMIYQFTVVSKLSKLDKKVTEFNEEDEEPSVEASTWWGALTGLVFGTLLTVSYWKDDIDWLSETPSDSESKVYIFIFIAVILLGEALVALTSRKYKKLPTSRKLKRAYRLTLTLPGAVGLVFALLQNQTRNDTLTDRFFTSLALVVIPIGTIWAYFAVYKNARKHLREEQSHFVEEKRKSKEIKKKKRKKNRKRR